jgi:hypothetical protein
MSFEQKFTAVLKLYSKYKNFCKQLLAIWRPRDELRQLGKH